MGQAAVAVSIHTPLRVCRPLCGLVGEYAASGGPGATHEDANRLMAAHGLADDTRVALCLAMLAGVTWVVASRPGDRSRPLLDPTKVAIAFAVLIVILQMQRRMPPS